nr:HD-GYP domain-containing protein [Candidatus Calescibacterium sp.]
MIRVSVNDLKPGMRVAYPVLREDGSILLNKGVVLTEGYIQKLRELGFHSIFIEHDSFQDVVVSEPLRIETRQRIQRMLHDTVRRLRRGSGVSYQEILKVLEEVLEEILDNPTTVFYLVQMQSRNDLIFQHSVNVAILSLLTGKCLNLPKLQLRKLGLGALLHDLGKVRLPEELLLKERQLTEEEIKLIRMHPVWSKEMIQKNPEYDFLASVIALQHHERLDGSGYPYGLSGEEIHFLSRICACADVYDALTVDRPYRKRFSYAEALEYLMGNASRLFDLQVVTTMVRHIAPYPVGETVRLTTGEIAVVIRLNEGLPIRPVVRVIRDPNGQLLEKPKDVDLMKELTVAIVGTMEESFENFYTKEDLASLSIEHLID